MARPGLERFGTRSSVSARRPLRTTSGSGHSRNGEGMSLDDPCVVARDESGPRYVSHYHVRALRQGGFCVLEGIGDGLRYGRGEFNPPFGLVVGDPQFE